MRIGRRPLFFAALAVISLLLLEPTPSDLRWVNMFAAGLAMFWAVAVFIEERSMTRWSPDMRERKLRDQARSRPGRPPRD
jgi:hypothetical protein